MRRRDWPAIRRAAAAGRLEAFRGNDRDRFYATLQMAARTAMLAGTTAPLEKCLIRHRAVIADILAGAAREQ